MRNAYRTATAVLVALSLCTWQQIHAHRQPVIWTDIVMHNDQHSADITHRIHRHDAIAWLRDQGESQPSLANLRQRAKIALHAAASTLLWQDDDEPVEIEIVGAEAEGNHVFIYLQTGTTLRPINKLKASVLMGFNTTQTNRVNVDTSRYRVSFEFSAKTPAKIIGHPD